MRDFLTSVFGSVNEWTGISPEVQLKIVETAIVLLALVALRNIGLHVMRRYADDVRVRYQWRKIITYTTFVIGIFAISRIWLRWFDNFATFLGLLSAGLAIALKDPVMNLAGWLFIMWRTPFSVGDRIQIGDHAGDVIDQRIFQFTLLEIGNWVDADQSTGRIIHVPNGKVFTEPQANYTRGFKYIWNELSVTITFESDWRKAKRLLQDIANSHAEDLSEEAERRILEASRNFMIFYSALTPIVYTAVKDSGVVLSVRYLCDPRRRRGTTEAIWEDVLDAFNAAEDIDFAYPTTRFYDNLLEGKPGARAEPPAPPA